jgi:hypothetical protein
VDTSFAAAAMRPIMASINDQRQALFTDFQLPTSSE